MRTLSLGGVLVAGALGAAAVGGGTLTLFLRDAHQTIARVGREARHQTAGRVEGQVAAELGRAGGALQHIERAIASGAVDPDADAQVEALVFGAVLDDVRLEEASFTRGSSSRFDDAGEAVVDPEPRWEIAVARRRDAKLVTLVTKRAGDAFSALTRTRPVDGAFLSAPLEPAGPGRDPTQDATFSVIASKGRQNRAIWSDLHRAELDAPRPMAERRAIVSVQRTISDPAGRFVGVARVGMESDELDEVVRRGSKAESARVVLLAASTDRATSKSRLDLIARVDPSDRFVLVGADKDHSGDLRFASDHAPPEVVALLASDLGRGLDCLHPNADGVLDVGGERWAATLRELTNAHATGPASGCVALGQGGTEGWLVAVLAPEGAYTRELDRFRDMSLLAFGLSLALVVAVGAATIVALRRGLARVVTTTRNMRRFDFEKQPSVSAFREVLDVSDGLERAKTVVRALGRYVPIDLVKRLYERNEEPRLGGEMHELTLMFTDIEGFTTLSEKLPPAELARRLGDYLEAMTTAVESTGGTIDKYIGDAVMAFWNAPTPVDGHAVAACRAALACRAAVGALFASEKWAGLPPLVTRYGVHTATVMVGHYGAPTRLSYTALGDGVNLAARLEPLCKQYGVITLVSDDARQLAGDGFVFRRIDRVAVKGKSRGVFVHELVGAAGDADRADVIAAYERALDLYFARDFVAAASLLAPHAGADPPSAVLLARCRRYEAEPPPAAWDGVFVASSK